MYKYYLYSPVYLFDEVYYSTIMPVLPRVFLRIYN